MGDPKKDVIDTAVKQSSFAREQHMLGELLDPRKPNPASEAQQMFDAKNKMCAADPRHGRSKTLLPTG